MIKVIASAIIKNTENKVLAVKLKKNIVGGAWVPPGGKLNKNETMRECVKRELKEELDVEIAIKRIAGISEEEYEDGYWVFVLYEAEIISGKLLNLEPKKISNFSYVNPKDLKKYENIQWV
jgi:8-oxo-dGTP diphosphatase